MLLSNSDFRNVVIMLSIFGGLGVWEGYEVHPVFYSQSVVIFGFIGYVWYQIFVVDRRTAQKEISRAINSEDLHSE
jgi:hypothetical protein